MSLHVIHSMFVIEQMLYVNYCSLCEELLHGTVDSV